MTKRKWLVCLLALVATLCITFSAIGCGGKEKKNPEITLSATTLEMGLFEKQTINATLKDIDSAVIWSTSNDSIVTVVDGLVEAVNIGSATVTATAGDVSATCQITVNRGTITPEFDIITDTLSLIKGSVYPLDTTMILGDEIFDRAQVTVVMSGEDTGVIDIDQDFNITVNAYGTQKLTVTAKYGTITLVTKEITVNVEEVGAINTGIANNIINLTATAINDGSVNKFETDGFKALIDNVQVSNAIALSSADSTIVAIEGNKIVGKKIGSTVVTASFVYGSNTYDSMITVNVSKETVKVETDFEVKSSKDATNSVTGETAIDLSTANLPIALSEIKEVTCNGNEIAHASQGNVLTLIDAPTSDNEFLLATDRVDVIINGLIYQTAISNASEYKAWFTNIMANKGYTILTADIDLAGATTSCDGYWTGTLDGRGHTVSNFLAPNGFLRTSNELSKVKNIQLVNMIVSGSQGVLGGTVLGDWENVLILAKIVGAQNAYNVLSSQEYTEASLKNVVMMVTTDNHGVEYWGYGQSYMQGNGMTVENGYLVFGDQLILKRSGSTKNQTQLYTNVDALVSGYDKDLLEDAGWNVTDFPYMSDFSSALKNSFYTVDGQLKANSTVTIESSLFDAQYSLKQAVSGITLSGNKIVIGNVATATAFTVVVESANFDGVKIEIPLQTYNYVATEYSEDFVVTDGTNTTIDVSKVKNFSGSVKQVTVNGIIVNHSLAGNVLTFENKAVNVQSIEIYTNDTVYSLDVLVADNVVTSGSELFAILQKNYDLPTRKYVVIANDIKLDGTTAINTGFCVNFVLDGLGHTIYNAYNAKGLFGNDANAMTVKNITFENFKTNKAILGGKMVGDTLFENVTFANAIITEANDSDYLLYTANHGGNKVVFKDCNFDFAVNAVHQEKAFKLVPENANEGSVTFNNVKVTSNGTVVNIGENNYGTDFILTGKGLTISDKADYTTLTYTGNPEATSKQTLFDLSKLSTTVNGADIKTVYIAGFETTFTVSGTTLTIDKAVTGATNVKIFTSSAIYSVDVSVRDKAVATTYSGEYVVNNKGSMAIDLSKVSGYTSGSIIEVKVGNNVVTSSQAGSIVTMTGVVAHNVTEVTVYFADVAYKFEVLVVTDLIGDASTLLAYLKSNFSNTYALLTADIDMSDKGEVVATSGCSDYVLDGDNHTITGWYDSVGLIRYGSVNATWKDIKLSNIRSQSTLFGHAWKGNINFINVDADVYFIAGTTRGLLTYDSHGLNLTMTDCDFIITLDASKVTTPFYLNSSWSGSAPLPVDTENTFTYNNCTIISAGLIGEHGSNFTFNNCTVSDSESAVEITYSNEYVQLVDGKVTIDLTKLSQTINGGDIVATGNSSVYTTTENSITISNSSLSGDTTFLLYTTKGAYKFKTIVANFVLSDEASFKAWATAGHGTSGDKYAVVSQDITLTADVEINAKWFGGWTLNGLGHTVSNVYDYSGMFPGGAGNVTIKNITLNMKTCSSAFGDDWYGTNNFINVKINVSVPGHAGTANLLFDRVRDNTVFNFTDCEFKFNIDSGKQANEMALMKTEKSGIKVNFVNSKITSTGTIAELDSSIYTLDATSKVVDKNDVA